MTKQEKRDRRKARHQLQALLRRIAVRRMGLFSTGGQIRNATQMLADRFFADREFAEEITPVLEYLQSDRVIHA